MKFYLKLLTPLHIGTGNELQPIDYVIADKHYYHLTQKFVFNFIKSNNLLGSYTQWINKTTEQINNIETIPKKDRRQDQNQQLSELRKNFNLLKFCEDQKKEGQLIQALNNATDIIKVPLNRKQPDRNIRQQITDGKNAPYVPGSSIKGAIRTALLYQWLCYKNPDDAVKALLKIFNTDLNNEDVKKEQFGNQIENLAFYCGIEKKMADKTEEDYTDEKFDLLKLLSVSDGKIISAGNPLTLIKTNLYLQDNTRQAQSPWLEAIAPGCIVEFTIDFNIHFLYAIKDKIINDAVVIDKVKQWIGITKKTKELFGIDISTLSESNLEENRNQAIRHILTAITLFSKKQKEKNENWKKEIAPKHHRYGGRSPESFDKNKVDFSFIPDKNALNLGFASGFTGTTEMIYFLDNPQLKDAFKKVMDKFGIGDKPGAAKSRKPGEKYNANPDKFPKSRIMYEDKGQIKPLGWVLIIEEAEYNKSKSKETVHEPVQQEASSQTDYVPKYFTGKLKNGATVEALCLGEVQTDPRMKLFRLFIGGKGQEQEVSCKYESNIIIGKYCKVRITDIRNGVVKSIQIESLIKK